MSALSNMPTLGKNDQFDLSLTPDKSEPRRHSIPDKPSGASTPEIDDYPDGGLKAWLVVCGVRIFVEVHICDLSSY